MVDATGTCIVVSVRSYWLFKRVCFRAAQDCTFSRLMLRPGDRVKFPMARRYSLAAASIVCLPYVAWKHFEQGQTVAFSELAMHPLASWNGLRG